MAVIFTVKTWNINFKSITVEPIMFLYMFSSFLQFTTLQALIYDKVCMERYNDTVCDNLSNDTFEAEEDIVQKKTSTWFLYFNITMTVPAMLSMMFFLGPLGDTVGRKLPVLFPLVGASLASISNVVNSVYMEASISYLLIGAFLNGLMGSFLALLMATYSYIAHVSTPGRKTVRIGILEAMVFLSGTVGTALSGVMLDHTSYVFVFSLLLGIMILAIIYTVFWLENVKVEESETSPGQESAGVGAICQLFLTMGKDVFLCVYNKRTEKKKLVYLTLLILILFCLMLDTAGEGDILLIYTRYHPFNWSQTKLGLYKGLESFLRGLAVLTLLPLLKVKMKVKDTAIIIIGLLSKIALLIMLGVANSTALLFIGSVLGTLQGFGSAAIRSMSSSLVQTSEQAKLFSLIGIFESIASLAASSIFNNVYNATLEFFPGFCFLMAALIIGLCVLVAIYMHVTFYKYIPQEYGTLQNETVDDMIVNEDGIEPHIS
ncbi:hypothetical protein ACF0H5_003290 [Mactra antiquata]